MNEASAPARIKYKKPPIVERIFTITGDLAPENFYAKFESWKDLIQPYFSKYDPHKEWKLNIKLQNGVPIFTDSQPEVQITHRFFKVDEKGKKLVSMRILPNQFSLNLHYDSGQPHYFEELFGEIENWMPQWVAHFGVKGCSSVAVDYVNLISAATTPQFVRDNSVYIGEVLEVFVKVPMAYHGIIPPYDCQVGLMVDPERSATFALRVVGLMGAKVRVDFHSAVNKDKACMTSQQVLAETNFLHKVIIDQFETLFTSAAKRSFEPA